MGNRKAQRSYRKYINFCQHIKYNEMHRHLRENIEAQTMSSENL